MGSLFYHKDTRHSTTQKRSMDVLPPNEHLASMDATVARTRETIQLCKALISRTKERRDVSAALIVAGRTRFMAGVSRS
jgi:hypothetical protein